MTDLLEYARLCDLAYSGTKVGDHSYSVAAIGGRMVIAFAGTDNLENVLEDVSVWPERTRGGALAHAGVVRGYKELEASIAPLVDSFVPVAFAGHSLGGGIAQLFAERYQAPVVTFGSLRTWFRFGRKPQLDHTRVICDDDPVPMVPRMLYVHGSPAITLADGDHQLIDVKDHSIATYVQRLQGEA